MGFDRKAAIRRIKPQRKSSMLVRRSKEDLCPAVNASAAGREILLDTSVYIDVLQGKTPIDLDRLLQNRIVNHSTVALAEMAHLIGALDPEDLRTAAILKTIGQTIDDIPPHRLTCPSTRVYGEAGMLAGLVASLTGQKNSISLLNDALLFLQAAESGCDLLTGNIRDFDWLDQLLPGTGVLFYQQKNGTA